MSEGRRRAASVVVCVLLEAGLGRIRAFAPVLLWPAPKPFTPLVNTAVFLVPAFAGAAHQTLQLLAMDASARTTMKGAAKCDKHCELQNSVNQ